MAAAPRPTISYSFSMGSTIQLHSDPPRYGVIQWIGNLPEIHGQIAGVELVGNSIIVSHGDGLLIVSALPHYCIRAAAGILFIPCQGAIEVLNYV